MLQLITAMSELGAGTRGSSLGYAAIRSASFSIQPKFFRALQPRKVQTNNALLYRHPETPYGKRIRGIVRMTAEFQLSWPRPWTTVSFR